MIFLDIFYSLFFISLWLWLIKYRRVVKSWTGEFMWAERYLWRWSTYFVMVVFWLFLIFYWVIYPFWWMELLTWGTDTKYSESSWIE